MPSLSLSPESPGTLTRSSAGGGADCTFTVTSSGYAELMCVVVGTAPDYAWQATPVRIVPTGSDRVTAHFTANGQIFQVWSPADFEGSKRFTDPVTLTDPVIGAVTLEMAPQNPGTLTPTAAGAGVTWSTVIAAAGIARLAWVVMRSDYSWRNGATLIDLPAGTSNTQITCLLVESGDQLRVWDASNDSRIVFSAPVVIGAPGSAGSVFLSLSPTVPDTLPTDAEGGANFTFTIQSGGYSRLSWVVIGPAPDYAWQSGETQFTPTGNDQLTVRFTATGQAFQVWPTVDFNQKVYSREVILGGVADTTPGLRFFSDPGVLYQPTAGAGATWSFQVQTQNIARLGYVVCRTDFSWYDGGQIVTPSAGGVTTLSALLLVDGDFVKIYDGDDPGHSVDSGPVTLLVGGGGGTTPPASSDVAFAQAFVANLTLGVNVERWWAWGIPGGVPAYAAYLRSIGCTHVRLFYAYRPGVNMLGEGTNPPSKAQFARILDAAAQFIAAGLKVLLFFTDVLTTWEDLNNATNVAAVRSHMVNAAAWAAERAFDKTKIAYGPWNELGGDDDFTSHQLDWHGILRAALPGYVLSLGANYWQDYRYLLVKPPFTSDGRTLWPVHCYESHDAAGWASIASQLAAWSARYGGVPVTMDEIGLGDPKAPATYAAGLATMAPLGKLRPSLWAVTYGSDFKINLDTGKLTPAIEANFITIAATIAATNQGEDPPDPEPPVEGGGTVTPADPPPLIEVPVPSLFDLDWLFRHGSPDTEKPILLREAVTNAQHDLEKLAAFALGVTAALNAVVASVNSLAADMAAHTMPPPTGPYDDDAAAAAGGVKVGEAYFDQDGVIRRRMA